MALVDFTGWVIRVKYDNRRNIHNSKLRFGWDNKRFLLCIGLKSSTYEGLPYTRRDISLLEFHETEHVLQYIAGKSEPITNITFGSSRTQADISLEILQQERAAWKAVFYCMPFLNNDWLEKAQNLLTDYLFQSYERCSFQLRRLMS